MIVHGLLSTEVVRLDEAPLLDLLAVLTLFLVALFGAVIAYQAFRGYRRNDSTSMLYLSVGLLLLTVFPFVVNVTVNTLTTPDQIVTVVLENVSRLLGLLVIMYSLYGQR